MKRIIETMQISAAWAVLLLIMSCESMFNTGYWRAMLILSLTLGLISELVYIALSKEVNA